MTPLAFVITAGSGDPAAVIRPSEISSEAATLKDPEDVVAAAAAKMAVTLKANQDQMLQDARRVAKLQSEINGLDLQLLENEVQYLEAATRWERVGDGGARFEYRFEFKPP